jgi:hypothetical protein
MTTHYMGLLVHPGENSNAAFASRKPGVANENPLQQGGIHKMLGHLNDWMARRGFVGKFIESRLTGMYVCGTPDVNVEIFMVHLHTLPWLYPASVQVMYKGPSAHKFELWELKLDYFKDVQEFIASQAQAPADIRDMLEDAILLQGAQEPVHRRIQVPGGNNAT